MGKISSIILWKTSKCIPPPIFIGGQRSVSFYHFLTGPTRGPLPLYGLIQLLKWLITTLCERVIIFFLSYLGRVYI
jgi:hypothetical protein